MSDYTVCIKQNEIVGRVHLGNINFNTKIRQTEIKLLSAPEHRFALAFVVSVLRQTAPYLVFTVLADEQPNLKAI